MVTLLRQDFKKLLKDKAFKEYFPEYKELYNIKLSCCSFPEDLYKQIVQLVLNNKEKWKEYLRTDSIRLFYDLNGSRKSYII